MADAQKDLKIVIDGDSSGGENAFKSIANIAAGVGLERIIESIATSVIDLGQQFIDLGFQAATSMETTRVAFDTAFQGASISSRDMLNTLEDIAHATPFTSSQLDNLALRLQNTGVPTKQITGDLQDLADIAAGSGTSFSQMSQILETTTDALSNAYNRGSVSAIQLRGIANQGIPIYQALADIYNAQGKELDGASFKATDFAKSNKNIQITAQDLQGALQKLGEGKYLDSATKQADTYTGRLKNLKETIGETVRDIIGINAGGDIQKGGIFDHISQGAEKMIAFLNAHKGDIVKFGQDAAGAFLALSNFVTGTLVPAIMKLQPAFDFIVKEVQAFAIPIFKQLQTLWQQHHADIILIAQVLGGVLFVAIVGTIAIIGVLIQIVIGAVNIFLNLIQVFREQIPAAIGIVKLGITELSNFFSSLGTNVKKIMDGIISDVKAMVNGVIDAINTVINGANSIAGKVPGGKLVKLPTIPHLAEGTDYFQGGMAIVGEQGPELVNLPRGSQVLPADKTQSALNKGNQVQVTINNPVVRDDKDITNLAKEIVRVLGRKSELVRFGVL